MVPMVSSASDPFPPGIGGRRVVLNRGAVRIDDRGPNEAEQSFLFGMQWPAQEGRDFDIGHT
jgi:hypothetical protein